MEPHLVCQLLTSQRIDHWTRRCSQYPSQKFLSPNKNQRCQNPPSSWHYSSASHAQLIAFSQRSLSLETRHHLQMHLTTSSGKSRRSHGGEIKSFERTAAERKKSEEKG